jgi:hypothetical protein
LALTLLNIFLGWFHKVTWIDRWLLNTGGSHEDR